MNIEKSKFWVLTPWRLLLAVSAVQLVFWLVVDPVFINIDRPNFKPYEITEHRLIRTTSQGDTKPSEEAMAKAASAEPSLFSKGLYTIRTDFDLPDVPENGIALLDNYAGDNSRFYVNGKLLAAPGSMDLEKPTYHGLIKRINHIPSSMLVDGTNKIETTLLFGLSREAITPPPLLLDFKEAEREFGWAAFMIHEARIISIIAGAVLSLFLLTALIRSRDKSILFWLFCLSASWTFHNFYYFWVNIPIHGQLRGYVYCLVTLFLSACWPIFVDRWSGYPKRWFFVLMLGAFAVGAIGITYWLLFTNSVHAFDNSAALIDKMGLAFMAAFLARLAWHLARKRDEKRIWEAAIIVLLGLLFILFLYNNLFLGRSSPHLRLGQPLFLLAFAIAFFARNFQLFQSSAQISELLQGKLNLREAELEEAHVREKQLVREQAYGDERQRIMRDMHDGIGSSLMSMLFAAKNGNAKPEKVADDLQHLIDEMRLMIDSIDTVGESLSSALGTFRKRVQSRVEAAKFKFVWNGALDKKLPTLGSRQALQVFRIMQEAVANALKHSGGDTVSITIQPDPQDLGSVRISIEDNGLGITTTNKNGYGLDNMRARAAAIGAEISFSDTEPKGTCVELHIPKQVMPDPEKDGPIP